MSDKRPGDDRNRRYGDEPQIGLSLSRESPPEEETGHSTTETRPRRGVDNQARLKRATQVDISLVERWLIPFAALVLVLLVTVAVMYISQSSRLSTLQAQVAALGQQVANVDQSSGVDQLTGEMRALDQKLDTELQTIRSAVTDQVERTDKLASRVEKIESRTGSGSSTTTDSGSSSTSGQTSGGWVINLITVADGAAAEQFKARLDDLGVRSRIEPVTIDDKPLQRIVVPGFESRDAAEKAGADLKANLELSDDPWIARQ